MPTLAVHTPVRVDTSDLGTPEDRWLTAVVAEAPTNACELVDPDALTWIRYDDGRTMAVPSWRIKPVAEGSR